MFKKITILGLGVAGSLLAAKLSRDFHIVGFDPQKEYVKPCGEAVPTSFFNEYVRYTTVKAKIRLFTVNVDEHRVFEWNAKKDVWYIIDKKELVNNLREEALSNGAVFRWKYSSKGEGLVVDARGPFSNEIGRVIPVYRILAKVESGRWDLERVHIQFDSARSGFYWIFPAGDNMVNVGGGFFYEPKSVVKLVHKYVNKIFNKKSIIDKSASIITIKPTYRFYNNNIFYVGESAGLIMPSTGEGIRPALVSANSLATAIKEHGKDGNLYTLYRRYKMMIDDIYRESRLSNTLFKVTTLAKPRKRAKILGSLPNEFWKRYFSATLSSWKELFFTLTS